MFDFSGKKIIVTGASSGVGRETAILLSRMNAKIVAVARCEEELKNTLSMMEGSEHSYKIVDLSDFDRTVQAIKEIVDMDGLKIDGVAHCAGAVKLAPIRALSPTILDEMFRVNLYSFAAILKCAASKKLFNPAASVVAISSIIALNGQKGNAAYCAAKAAMIGLAKAADFELKEREIRVNLICPGGIDTSMLKHLPNLDINRLISPKEIANILSYYLSPYAEAISGTYISFGV